MSDQRYRTPEELRRMLINGLNAIGKLTPEIEKMIAECEIPERSQRPKPETTGMSERVLIQVRAIEIAWFKTNPGEQVLYRPMMPGEFPPDVTAEWVRVTKVDRDANHRARQPVIRVAGHGGIDWRDWKKE